MLRLDQKNSLFQIRVLPIFKTRELLLFNKGMNMIDQDLLDILACPENKTPVTLADQSLIDAINSAIEKGEVTNRGGQKAEETIYGGLVREDGAYLYPIQDDIPIMLIDEAIPLEGFASAS